MNFVNAGRSKNLLNILRVDSTRRHDADTPGGFLRELR